MAVFNEYDPDAVPGISEDFLCPICHGILRDVAQPAQTDSHAFCVACLTDYAARAMDTGDGAKLRCPLGCEGFSADTIVRVPFVDRLVNNLSAVCYAAEQGCGWQGSFLALRKDHWPGGCPFHKEACSMCKEPIPVAQLSHHEADVCPKRPCSCDYCHATMVFEFLEDHLEICDLMLLSCPYACGTPFRRCDEEQHFAACPKAPVSCPIQRCGATVCRSELEAHLTNAAVVHLLWAVEEVSALRQAVERPLPPPPIYHTTTPPLPTIANVSHSPGAVEAQACTQSAEQLEELRRCKDELCKTQKELKSLRSMPPVVISSGPGDICYRCGQSGHWARGCPRSTVDPESCFKCHTVGHWAHQCPM